VNNGLVHIGFVVEGFPPYSKGGGIVSYVAEIARTLHQEGHPVVIFSLLPEENSPENYCYEGLPVVVVPRVSAGRILPSRATTANAQRVAKAIRHYQDQGNELDVLEVPDIGAFGLFIDVSKVKLVARLHTGILEIGRLRGRGLDPRVLSVHRLEKLALHRAHLVTALTCYQRNFAKNLYGLNESAMRVIPNFVKPQQVVKIDRIGQRIGFFATVGRLKGTPVLCSAFNVVSSRHPETSLIIAGRDTAIRLWFGKRSAIEFCKKILREPERVHFTGLLTREGTLREMQQCDIVVLPSMYEAFPMVLLEAMAQSIPVVASRVCGNSEIVMDGKSGLLVKPGDPEDLATAINTLLDNPETRTAMGFEGRRVVESKFSDVAVIPRLIDLYRGL